MSAWPPHESLRSVEVSIFGSMKPAEVLYEYDGPCIFTFEAPSGALLLAYLCEELEDSSLLRYIVATTSSTTVEAMKSGMASVREAMGRGSLWLVDVDYGLVPKQAFAVSLDELPEDALPAPSTMLWAELEPTLLVRLAGKDFKPGEIPSAAFAQAAEIGAKALKPIFEWAARELRSDKGGRPPEWLRLLYGLQAQRFAYGSLEVAFRTVDLSAGTEETLPHVDVGMPAAEQIRESGWKALEDGLAWATSPDAVPQEDEGKWLAVLEAMKRLSPSSTGPVESVEVSGAVVGRRSFVLGRDSSKKIRSALTELKKRHEVTLRVFTGRVRELDLDKLTMILRDVPGEVADVQLGLEEEGLLEVAREAHYQELDVQVSARRADKGSWSAVEIEFVQMSPEPPPSE